MKMRDFMRTFGCCVVFVLSGCLGVAADLPQRDGGGTGGGAAMEGDSGVGGGDGDGGRATAQDAGAVDAGRAELDAGPVVDAGADRVPVFVAVGKQGRRAVSCDDGRTWRHDVSLDDAWPANERYRCFSGDFTLPDGGTQGTDCDHNAYSSTSLAYADGAFIQTLGWGAPGTFHRSTDAVTWQQVDMGANVADVMFAGGRLIAATRSSRRSDDLGLTWSAGGDIDLANGSNPIWNVRGGVAGGGVFLVTAQDGANLDLAYSANGGTSWQRPTMQGGGRVDACGAGHPAWGNGVFVTLSWSSAQNATVVCRSADGAATWTSSTIPGENMESRPLWTGTEFMVWSNGKVHRSPDGVTWTSTNTQTRRNGVLSGGPNIGAAAHHENGAFVAVKGGWQVWYEQQRFYRSTDGVTWDELATGDYVQGHPITAMSAGFATRSTGCP